MFEAVIFDFGGVMHSLEGTSAKSRIFQALSANRRMDQPLFETSFRKYTDILGVGKIDEINYWHKLCEELDVPRPDNYQELWRRDLRENAQAYPEMFDLVEHIKGQQILTAVLSIL